MKIYSQVIPDAQSSRGKRPLWRRLFNLTVLASLVVLAVRYVDFAQVWDLIVSADWRYVLLVLALATTSRFLMAWKWHRLLTAAEVPAGFEKALGAYYRSSMVSQVPFMVIGADLLRIHWIGGSLGKRAVVAATVVMEKALGLISAFFLGTLGLSLILASHRAEEQNVTLVVVGLFGLVASLLLLPSLSQHGLAAALTAVALMFLTFEFGIVSLLALATQVAPEARASLLALNITALSLGRILGALIGGWLWRWQDIALHAWVGAACALLAAILLAWGMVEPGDQRKSR